MHREEGGTREWLSVPMRYGRTDVARVHNLLLARNRGQRIINA